MCGNNIKFINVKDKGESILPSPGDGVGVLAVSSVNNKFAFAEVKPDPKIFIYSFPNFTQPRATLESECKMFMYFEFIYCGSVSSLGV